MREIAVTTYNAERFTDENVLYKNRLIDPVSLSRGLTYLYGKDSDMFPLLSLTDGQRGITSVKPKTMNDTQYTWKVMGRMRHTSRVVGLVNSNNTKPGFGGTTFEVDFEDNWILKFYTVTTPDKKHNCRAQGNPKQIGPKQFRYRMIILTGNSNDYIDLSNFENGLSWVLGAPVIPLSKSDGTTSHSMAPGEWTSQFGLYRFGKQITGNVSNKVVNIEFDLEGGGKTNYWMPFEMKLWELDRRLMLEEKLWNSKYNRDEYGNIFNKDEETGEPLPESPGIKDILYTTGQYDTYSTLTISKLDSLVNKITANRVDVNRPMELVLYTGSGGIRMINEAITNDAISKGFYEKLGHESIMSGKDGFLSYGRYFNQYKTIDGHIITIKKASLFDNGTLAEMDKANGRMYKGFPESSYDLFLLDHSLNDSNERNIELVAEEGREILTGIYKGMTPLPASWGAIANDKLLSSKKDEASYEVIVSQGIALRNYTTSMWLNFIR